MFNDLNSARRARLHFLCVLFTLTLLSAFAALPAASQTKQAPRLKPRSVPVAASSPFTLSDPPMESASHGPASFPSGNANAAEAHLFHGGRPGPVAAYLFHGFSSDEAFHLEMEAIFGSLNLKQFQGTVLAVSLPARQLCEGNKACPTLAPTQWTLLAPALLDASRFVVDVHQSASGATAASYAFVYLPHEDARLATYVKAMARALLAPNVVELNEAALETAGASAVALEHLAPQALALGHPAISLEIPRLEGNQNASSTEIRKGMGNLLRHLKMSGGTVGWKNGAKLHSLDALGDQFFQAAPTPLPEQR